ncbi:hypothetical protein CN135_32010 [Sinorhizobium meliloti]
MRGSVGAACPFSPPAGRRCRQADEGRVTANANVSAYGFDPEDPSARLATDGNTDAAAPECRGIV